MRDPERAIRVGGAWVALASLMMVVVLALHGPIAPDLSEQMTRIARNALRWSVLHWLAAVALSLYAVSGLIVLTAGSRLTEGWSTLTAWAVVCVGSLWTMTTAVAEATVIAEAASSGSDATFAAWWRLAEGKANGFAFVALAVAVIAGTDARSRHAATPVWSAWAATVAGIASFVGWSLGMWLGFRLGNVLWVAATIVMSLWLVGFGVALARAPLPAPDSAATGAARADRSASGSAARP